jgi:hypothetical protein
MTTETKSRCEIHGIDHALRTCPLCTFQAELASLATLTRDLARACTDLAQSMAEITRQRHEVERLRKMGGA